jgi:hypothetical protein
MSRPQQYYAVLVIAAVGVLGWIGVEQHLQTQESIKQTCIAKNAAINDIATAEISDLVAVGNIDQAKADSLNRAVKQEDVNVHAC